MASDFFNPNTTCILCNKKVLAKNKTALGTVCSSYMMKLSKNSINLFNIKKYSIDELKNKIENNSNEQSQIKGDNLKMNEENNSGKNTPPKNKWYLKTWFICLCFLLWQSGITLIIGIILLILQHQDNEMRDIKYGEFDEIENKINELNRQYQEKQEASQSAFKDLENENITQLEKTTEEIEKLKEEKELLEAEIKNYDQELIIKYTDISDYSNITSQEIKNKLNLLKLDVNDLVKNNKAIDVSVSQDKNNKKIINSNIKQLLRSYNNECDSIIQKLTIKNVDSSRTKFERSFIALNKLYEVDNVQITRKYYELKLQELTLNYTYIQQLENEKEQQRAIREQMVEEEKVRKEIEREKAKLDKEERQFKNEVSKLMGYLNKSNNDVEKQLYVDKIRELEEKLKLLEKDKENVLQREQNTRAGFVYIISNIGSFGDNIYKIGMTRRLEPMDRIKELGDASVPFGFDVHAMIFSEDAPTLENTLHQTFKENQVNKLNSRKEFFNIDLEKIKEVVKDNYNNTVDFTDYAEAYEYRESLKLEPVN